MTANSVLEQAVTFCDISPAFQIFLNSIQIKKQPHFLTAVSGVIRHVTGQANFVSDLLSQKGGD